MVIQRILRQKSPNCRVRLTRRTNSNPNKASAGIAMSTSASTTPPGHLKLRYSFLKVCEIFEVHPDTLRRWMRDGVPLSNGERVRIHFIPLGPRRTVFERDEVERVYQLLRASSINADVLPFPEEDGERDERRTRGESRRLADRDKKK